MFVNGVDMCMLGPQVKREDIKNAMAFALDCADAVLSLSQMFVNNIDVCMHCPQVEREDIKNAMVFVLDYADAVLS